MLRKDQIAGVKLNNTLDQVLQFPDIPVPVQRQQKFLRLRRQPHTAFLPDTVGYFLDKISGKRNDVIPALAQRGQIDLHGTDPIEQIRAELFLFDHGPDIGIRCSDNLHIHIDHPRASQTHQLLLLHHAEELCLEIQRHLPDLVQEDRSSGSQLKLSDIPVFARSGKCSAVISEQLTLNQVFRHRAAVDCDKGLIPAAARVMNRLRQNIFSRAAFPKDQDIAVRPRHLLCTV